MRIKESAIELWGQEVFKGSPKSGDATHYNPYVVYPPLDSGLFSSPPLKPAYSSITPLSGSGMWQKFMNAEEMVAIYEQANGLAVKQAAHELMTAKKSWLAQHKQPAFSVCSDPGCVACYPPESFPT